MIPAKEAKKLTFQLLEENFLQIQEIKKHLLFKYVRRGRNSVLLDRDDIVLWSRNYLRSVKTFRDGGKTSYG
nr:unnamed protein product [Callosobruchus chinensis]